MEDEKIIELFLVCSEGAVEQVCSKSCRLVQSVIKRVLADKSDAE